MGIQSKSSTSTLLKHTHNNKWGFIGTGSRLPKNKGSTQRYEKKKNKERKEEEKCTPVTKKDADYGSTEIELQ
ncbi:hypothetical protein L6452_11218 [Arctium lappa]|uniref:Uncharacterized protein n=1 Tax=Arctium lappa TaxID=4217 RepID=A0ACB9DPW6_ARCLA|nr:hypothetical protein L6452_11218 [Arctium lappa]